MTILSLIRKSLILKMIMKFSLKIREFEQNWKMIVIPFIENVEFRQNFWNDQDILNAKCRTWTEFGQNFRMTRLSLSKNPNLTMLSLSGKFLSSKILITGPKIGPFRLVWMDQISNKTWPKSFFLADIIFVVNRRHNLKVNLIKNVLNTSPITITGSYRIEVRYK